MRYTEHDKKSIAVATARFVRKAHGRITKREAARLGRLYGVDLHWKYLGVSGDKLEGRPAGGLAHEWTEYLGDLVKEDFAKYGKGLHTGFRKTVDWRLGFLFGWYGPNGGLWPGDTLVLAEGAFGKSWVVKCAADCPCGKCLKEVA